MINQHREIIKVVAVDNNGCEVRRLSSAQRNEIGTLIALED
jgi:hypothetical protein